MAIPYLACMMTVATFYGLPPRVLPAIQAVEGGRIGTVSRNRDGSEDLGLMQVNTRWIQPLSRVTGLPPAAVRERLIGDGCFSVATAGAIVHHHLRANGGDLLKAVGNYHSRTPHLHQAYLTKVVDAAGRLRAAPPPFPAQRR